MCVYKHVHLCLYLKSNGPCSVNISCLLVLVSGSSSVFCVSALIKDGTSLCVLCLALCTHTMSALAKSATFAFKTGTELQSNILFKTIKV